MSPTKLRLTRSVSLQELEHHYRLEKDPQVKIRLHMLLRVKDGVSGRQVAREHHCAHQTVALWVHRFNAQGFTGLKDRPRPGRPAKATKQQVLRLIARPPTAYGYDLPAWTPRAIRTALEEQYEIKYSLLSIYDVIKRCDLRLITPRPTHYKQRPKQVVAFKKNADPAPAEEP